LTNHGKLKTHSRQTMQN